MSGGIICRDIGPVAPPPPSWYRVCPVLRLHAPASVFGGLLHRAGAGTAPKSQLALKTISGLIRLIKAQPYPPRHRGRTATHAPLGTSRAAPAVERSRGLGGGGAGLTALAALVVLVVGVFDQAIVERVADFEALGANEVDAVDGFVDALAVEDPALELFYPEAHQVQVLAFDLAAAGFVLGKVGIFVGLVGRAGETGIKVTLGGLALASPGHRFYSLPLARARDVAAVLVADQEEAAPAVAGEHRDLALGAATRTNVLVGHIAALFRCLRFFLSHDR